jgi:ribonuclease HI
MENGRFKKSVSCSGSRFTKDTSPFQCWQRERGLVAPGKRLPMKKKHLRSLTGMKKWLDKENLLSPEVENAFTTLRETIEKVEEETLEANAPLPPPVEIYGEPETLALYSDGGCRNNPGPGAFAFLIQTHNGEVLAEGSEYESLTTNNKLELSGPLKGLEELLDLLPAQGRDPLLTKVKVITDSKYVVDGMKSWVEGWKARGWKKADNKAPENLELWQELDKIRQRFMQVEWAWVKGHAGHPQNEYCDRRANELMDENAS